MQYPLRLKPRLRRIVQTWTRLRYGQRRERLPGAPDREVTSLAELPALVGAGAARLAT
jgi:hypothetical protein